MAGYCSTHFNNCTWHLHQKQCSLKVIYKNDKLKIVWTNEEPKIVPDSKFSHAKDFWSITVFSLKDSGGSVSFVMFSDVFTRYCCCYDLASFCYSYWPNHLNLFQSAEKCQSIPYYRWCQSKYLRNGWLTNIWRNMAQIQSLGSRWLMIWLWKSKVNIEYVLVLYFS